jgi:hypothetical protein
VGDLQKIAIYDYKYKPGRSSGRSGRCVVGAYERNSRCWISKVPTSTPSGFIGLWWESTNMWGEIQRQDETLSIDVLHEVDKILEAKWRSTGCGPTCVENKDSQDGDVVPRRLLCWTSRRRDGSN